MTTETLITAGENTQPAEQQQQVDSTTPEGQPAAGEGQTTEQQATSEQKPEGQEAQGEGTEASEEQPEGAPEKYEFTPPEGREFDEAVIGVFSEVAKELNLPQASAQKVLDKVAPVIEARQAEAVAELHAQWLDAARSDTEFGGTKLDNSLVAVRKARETFATPELRSLLEQTRLGDHPEFIRLFYRVGNAISEDNTIVKGRQPAGTNDGAKSLYPNSNLN